MKPLNEETWTWEQALAADEKDRKGSGATEIRSGGVRPKGPIVRWIARNSMEKLRLSYQAGEEKALMDAVSTCAWGSIPMPDWVADAFWLRHQKVDNYELDSWDKAFGRPLPRNSNVNAKKKEHDLSVLVWREVAESREPVDSALFEKIGKAMDPPIGASTARNYYYAMKPVADRLDEMKQSYSYPFDKFAELIGTSTAPRRKRKKTRLTKSHPKQM
jgi:hypothetical protein